MKDLTQARKIYDKNIELYAKEQEHDKRLRDLRKDTYTLMGNLRGRKILFAGCGPGFECISAVKQGAIVTGIDISKKSIEYAHKICPKAEFHVMDFEKTKFSNASFDIVVSILTVMYKKNFSSVLAEFKRLVRKNGRIIIAVPHPIRKMIKYSDMNYFVRGKRWETWQDIRRFNYYMIFSDYINCISQSGFKIKKLAETSPVTEVRHGTRPKYPMFLIFQLEK